MTEGQLMDLTLTDDVSTLRRDFGGIWGLIHVITLIVFFFPYVWFLVERLIRVNFMSPNEDTVTLLEALLRFILRGGRDWQESWEPSLSFYAFVFVLLYNVARSVLLWKTKKLETDEEVKGYPVRFSFSDRAEFTWKV